MYINQTVCLLAHPPRSRLVISVYALQSKGYATLERGGSVFLCPAACPLIDIASYGDNRY
jgi:hypothetical protein